MSSSAISECGQPVCWRCACSIFKICVLLEGSVTCWPAPKTHCIETIVGPSSVVHVATPQTTSTDFCSEICRPVSSLSPPTAGVYSRRMIWAKWWTWMARPGAMLASRYSRDSARLVHTRSRRCDPDWIESTILLLKCWKATIVLLKTKPPLL